ncbi:hypothetical protein FALCPG4_003742 [Fusarium falciforme]
MQKAEPFKIDQWMEEYGVRPSFGEDHPPYQFTRLMCIHNIARSENLPLRLLRVSALSERVAATGSGC